MNIPGRSVMLCPVDGCAWTLSQADVELKVPLSLKWRPGETLDEAIAENSRKWHARVEEMIRGHLESHDVMDWLRTVRRLEQKLYNAGPTGVRPHAYERLREAAKVDWPEPASPQPVRLDVAGYEPGDTPRPPRVDS